MTQTFLPLREYPARALDCLVAVISGDCDARVVLTDRVVHPLTISLKCRTLVVSPSQCGLWDLCLGARLLKMRRNVHAIHRAGRALNGKRIAQWVSDAAWQLVQDLPGTQRLAGHYQGRIVRDRKAFELKRNELPEIVWSSFRLKPLDSEHFQRPDRKAVYVPGLDFQSTGDDLEQLIANIEKGKVSPEELPDLPGLKTVTLPVSVHVPDVEHAKMEHAEMLRKSVPDVQESLAQCYRDKSISTIHRGLERHRALGTQMDTTRLPRAMVAARMGQIIPLFRKRKQTTHRTFQPEQHLMVKGTDMACLDPSDDNSKWSVRGELVAANVFLNLLGIRSYVNYLFHDRLVTLSDGSPLIAHIPIRMRAWDDYDDNAFWHRLVSVLMAEPVSLPGVPAALIPLQLRTLTNEMERIRSCFDHTYRSVHLASMRGMPRRHEAWDEMMEEKMVDALEKQLEQLYKQYDRPGYRLDTEFIFIPYSVKARGAPGGYVQQLSTM